MNKTNNYNTAQAAFDAWLVDRRHKANIEADFTQLFFSIIINPAKEVKYYTNIFRIKKIYIFEFILLS